MAKKSYKIKKTRSIDSILLGLDIQLLSMKIDAPIREGMEWVVGQIDNEDDLNLHYLRCETHEAALEVVNELITNHGCIRGQDFGENSTIVYLSCEDI